jgi:hypothetical protein
MNGHRHLLWFRKKSKVPAFVPARFASSNPRTTRTALPGRQPAVLVGFVGGIAIVTEKLPPYRRGSRNLRFAVLMIAVTGALILLLVLFLGEPPHPM